MELQSTKRKAGRSVAHYRTASGDTVVGLSRYPDGRWRNSFTGKMWREPEERFALDQFDRQCVEAGINKNKKEPRQGEPGYQGIGVYANEAVAVFDKNFDENLDQREVIHLREHGGQTTHQEVVEGVDGSEHLVDAGPVLVRPLEPSPTQWNWIKEAIIKRPKWVAGKVGIEQIGYLTHLKPSEPSPKLRAVGDVYKERTDITPQEVQKCFKVWGEFVASVKVATLKDLTPELVARYAGEVRGEGLAPKSIAHRFNRVKTVLNHYLTTGKALGDTRHALDCFAVVKTPEAVSANPHPISREDFHKLLAAAENEGGEGKAMLLVALNCCFNPVDVSRIVWDHLDTAKGVYHAKRGKTKVPRGAVLWKRTIDALESLPKNPDGVVFHRPSSDTPHNANTLRKWFARLREKAGVVKKVKFEQVRDGAYTGAMQGEGTEFRQAQVMAGHRSGIADAYVLRVPNMTAGACRKVEIAYFGEVS